MIDLRQLRYFVVLAEELNFSRAAVRLHITQPPLSQQIMQLEADLDTPLFIRGKRPLRLTPAGNELLVGARRLLAQADVVVENTRLAGQGQRGRLGITFVAGALPCLLPECIGTYRGIYPNIELELREGVTATQHEAILAREMDVGFARPIGNDNGRLSTRSLITEPMMLALREQHPLARRKHVPVPALAAEPFILFSRKNSLYFHDIVAGILRRAQVSPIVVQDATQLSTVVALVSSGIGLAIVPASARHMRLPGVTFRELNLPQPVPAVLELVWRTEDRDPALTNFIEIAIAQARRYETANPP